MTTPFLDPNPTPGESSPNAVDSPLHLPDLPSSPLAKLLAHAAHQTPDALFHRNYPGALVASTAEGVFLVDGLRLHAPEGVYSPSPSGSSRFVADRWGMAGLDVVTGKGRLLDLGCGSGVLGLLAARQGWTVSAGDINTVAVDTARNNAAANGLALDVRESDLFSAFKGERFDAIVFNLPFFHKASVEPHEIALADLHGRLARRFLREAPHHLEPNGHVVFTFSNCSDPTVLHAPGWTFALAGCDYDPRGQFWRVLLTGRTTA